MTAVRIGGVRPGSLAASAGIEPGDSLLTVGGRPLRDVIDLQFLQAEGEVEVVFQRTSGDRDSVIFEKDPDEDLGLEFESATWSGVTLCNNNCFFCFLKGLPRGMRRTLYVKDDDYRLSFLHGNFVTLTNLAEEDWARLTEQRLGPLNVSVHASEPALRRSMLGNPAAPDITAQLRRLGELGIQAHTQVVLCPGVNDGEHLDRTLDDLIGLVPTVLTVSIVPVGASPRLEERALARDGLALLRPSRPFARALVDQVAPRQRASRRATGRTVVQLSDEYYLAAGVRVPGAATYDGFPQYENGVGMVRRLLDDWARTRARLARTPLRRPGLRVRLGTGTLAGPLLAPMAADLASLTGADLEVRPVDNTVFGDRVNVSGLVCGTDFVRVLAPGPRPDLVILPRPSLDYFGTRFLDDLSIEEVERRLGAPVAFASRWSDVVSLLSAGPARPGPNAASNGSFWSPDPRGVG